MHFLLPAVPHLLTLGSDAIMLVWGAQSPSNTRYNYGISNQWWNLWLL